MIRAADRRLTGTAALVFVASAAVTIYWCRAMPSMDMEMPGGWTMSMAWMRMPGQGWVLAAASFLGMWSVMMVAMMLPAFVPMLSNYRRRTGAGTRELVAVSAGYFGAWVLFGAACWPVGVEAMDAAMRDENVARAVPLVAALMLLLAGALQLSRWKARQLACCREPVPRQAPDCCAAVPPRAPLRDGWQLGLRCLRCCAPLTALLFVMGAMDLAAMFWVTAAISLERLAPRGEYWARLIGVGVLLAGVAVSVGALE